MTLSDFAPARRAGGVLDRWREARRSRLRDLALSGLCNRLRRDIGLEPDGAGLPNPMLGPFI